MTDDRIGEIIEEKWTVEHLLGTGSMASVYAVRHRNGLRAALKVMRRRLLEDESAAERFLAEGHLANAVDHPGIVKILDDGITADGCVFLVMEMLSGQTLEQYRVERGGRLAPSELVEIGARLLDVMASVHDASILHRDLKLTNVFLTTDGALKLLDFGLARSLLATRRPKSSVMGAIMGTPAFMAPEQARGENDLVDARSEVYSVGAMFFALLTGEVVHDERNAEMRLIAAGSKKARSILTLLPALAPDLAEVIDRALMYDRRDRFATMRDMRTALMATRVARGLSPLPSDADASADLDPGSATVLDMAPPPMTEVAPEPAREAEDAIVVAALVESVARTEPARIPPRAPSERSGVFSLPPGEAPVADADDKPAPSIRHVSRGTPAAFTPAAWKVAPLPDLVDESQRVARRRLPDDLGTSDGSTLLPRKARGPALVVLAVMGLAIVLYVALR